MTNTGTKSAQKGNFQFQSYRIFIHFDDLIISVFLFFLFALPLSAPSSCSVFTEEVFPKQTVNYSTSGTTKPSTQRHGGRVALSLHGCSLWIWWCHMGQEKSAACNMHVWGSLGYQPPACLGKHCSDGEKASIPTWVKHEFTSVTSLSNIYESREFH